GHCTGGEEIFTWTSRAPASFNMATTWRCVLPRTMESSTTITDFPATTEGCTLSFSRIPNWRRVWDGLMKVRPTYEVLTNPCPSGMPDSSAQPMAAGVPDSGTGTTTSASATFSWASWRPISKRDSYTLRPLMAASGRATYTYSKMQRANSG